MEKHTDQVPQGVGSYVLAAIKFCIKSFTTLAEFSSRRGTSVRRRTEAALASVVNLSLDLRKEQLNAHLFFIEGSLFIWWAAPLVPAVPRHKAPSSLFPWIQETKTHIWWQFCLQSDGRRLLLWLFAETKALFVSQNLFSLINPRAKSQGDLTLTSGPINVGPSSGRSLSSSWPLKDDWYRRIPRESLSLCWKHSRDVPTHSDAGLSHVNTQTCAVMEEQLVLF